MTAFSPRQMQVLHDGVRVLYNRMRALDRCELTHDEFLALFAPPEDREFLKRTPSLTNESPYCVGCTMSWPDQPGKPRVRVAVTGSCSGNHPFMPLHPALPEDVPGELLQRVTEWVERQTTLAIDFGRVRSVLAALNAHCSNPKQVRYLWPPVLALCKVREELAGLAEKLEEFKVPSQIPSLPVELRAACRKSAGTVTAALLVPEVPSSTAEATLSVDVSGHLNEGGFSFGPM